MTFHVSPEMGVGISDCKALQSGPRMGHEQNTNIGGSTSSLRRAVLQAYANSRGCDRYRRGCACRASSSMVGAGACSTRCDGRARSRRTRSFMAIRARTASALYIRAICAVRRASPETRDRLIRAEEAILLPVALSLAFALLDFFPRLPFGYCLVAATAVVVGLRLVIARLDALRRPALAFARRRWRYSRKCSGWTSHARRCWPRSDRGHAAATDQAARRRNVSFAARVPDRLPDRRLRLSPTLLGIQSTPQVDFFEDEHQLVPASEMLRGELPYRDVVPVHALLTDGGIDLAAMKTGDDTIGELLTTRRVVSAINLVAIYAVGYAATGSAGLGLLGAFVGIALFPAATIWLRTIPALFALATACSAVRLRSIRRLRMAGALLVPAFLMGMEFAVYSGIVTVVVALMLSQRAKGAHPTRHRRRGRRHPDGGAVRGVRTSRTDGARHHGRAASGRQSRRPRSAGRPADAVGRAMGRGTPAHRGRPARADSPVRLDHRQVRPRRRTRVAPRLTAGRDRPTTVSSTWCWRRPAASSSPGSRRTSATA